MRRSARGVTPGSGDPWLLRLQSAIRQLSPRTGTVHIIEWIRFRGKRGRGQVALPPASSSRRGYFFFFDFFFIATRSPPFRAQALHQLQRTKSSLTGSFGERVAGRRGFGWTERRASRGQVRVRRKHIRDRTHETSDLVARLSRHVNTNYVIPRAMSRADRRPALENFAMAVVQ